MSATRWYCVFFVVFCRNVGRHWTVYCRWRIRCYRVLAEICIAAALDAFKSVCRIFSCERHTITPTSDAVHLEWSAFRMIKSLYSRLLSILLHRVSFGLWTCFDHADQPPWSMMFFMISSKIYWNFFLGGEGRDTVYIDYLPMGLCTFPCLRLQSIGLPISQLKAQCTVSVDRGRGCCPGIAINCTRFSCSVWLYWHMQNQMNMPTNMILSVVGKFRFGDFYKILFFCFSSDCWCRSHVSVPITGVWQCCR